MPTVRISTTAMTEVANEYVKASDELGANVENLIKAFQDMERYWKGTAQSAFTQDLAAAVKLSTAFIQYLNDVDKVILDAANHLRELDDSESNNLGAQMDQLRDANPIGPITVSSGGGKDAFTITPDKIRALHEKLKALEEEYVSGIANPLMNETNQLFVSNTKVEGNIHVKFSSRVPDIAKKLKDFDDSLVDLINRLANLHNYIEEAQQRSLDAYQKG